jgi:hypothetical protein
MPGKKDCRVGPLRRLAAALAVVALPAAALAVVALPAAALVALPAGLAQAAGAPALPTSDPFYSYPAGALTAARPGQVLRSRPATLVFEGHALPVTTTQLLYRTVGARGQPTATVTTVIHPVGSLLRRIVSWQMFYDALGSECDPSYTLQGGNPSYGDANEEEALFAPYLASGDTVVVSDYEGEDLEWGAGREAGWDTLDGIRAAEAFLGDPAATTPVAMVGYSGGAIATEWAAELAPSYAPELDLVGAAAGGVPVDYAHNLAYINGSPSWSGVIPAIMVGLSRAYDIDLAPYLSARGEEIVSQVQGGCINSFTGAYPGLTLASLVQPQYADLLAQPVFARVVDSLIMSTGGTPRQPLLLAVGDADGTGDGVMVAADVEALAHTYCDRGVDVDFAQFDGLDHTEAAVPFEAAAEPWVAARLAGLPVPSDCSVVGQGNSLAPLAAGPPSGPASSPAAPTLAPDSSPLAAASPPPSASGSLPAVTVVLTVHSLARTGADDTWWALAGAVLVLDGLAVVQLAGTGLRRNRGC